MNKQNIFIFIKSAVAHQVNEPGHGFAGVYRIHQNTFQAGEHPHGFCHFRCRQRIAGADIFVITAHRFRGNIRIDTHMRSGFCDQFVYQLFLLTSGSADIDPDHRYVAVVAGKTGDQTRMGPGAAAGADDTIDIDSPLKGLGQDFFRTGHITGGPHRSGSAAGDDIGFSIRFGDIIGNLLHRGCHVGAAGSDSDLFDTHQSEQEVISAGLRLITAGDALF